MARYRRKPVEVEAVQWYPDPVLGEFVGKKWNCRKTGYDQYGVTYTVTEVGIGTTAGFMRMNAGDWVITGVVGERFPCTNEVFRKTYEPVE